MNGTDRCRVCVVSLSDVNRDARVARYVEWLKPDHEVTLISYTEYPDTSVRSILVTRAVRKLPQKLVTTMWGKVVMGRDEAFYWSSYDFAAVKKNCRDPFDIVIANDVTALPIAFELVRSRVTVFDAHEFTPEQYSDILWRVLHRRYVTGIIKRYIGRADWVTTVSSGVAEEYHRFCGIRPDVLTNAAEYHDLQPSKVNPARVRIVHHGGAGKSRRIEEMIRMMRFVDSRFELHLMLVSGGEGKYLERLRQMAARYRNIHFHDPVPQQEVVRTLSEYDIGLFIAPPVTVNLRHTLPNKLFDFVQARLMVAIGPTPEMRKLVEQNRLGIVAEDFTAETMARRLNELRTEQVVEFKCAANQAALSLSAVQNSIWYRDRLERLVSARREIMLGS